MDAATVGGWVNTVVDAVKRLGEVGVHINIPAIILVFSTVEAIKAVDRRAWKQNGKKRGARPGDQGYLVAVYPFLPMVVGAAWGCAWGFPAGALDGAITGAIIAAVYKGISKWIEHRKLLAKIKAEGG